MPPSLPMPLSLMPPNGVSDRRLAEVVDVHHAGLQPVLQRQCTLRRAGEGIGRQAELQGIGARQHVVDVVEGHAGRDRAEGLLGHRQAVVGHVGEHGRREEVARAGHALAAGLDTPAAAARVVDEAVHRRHPARMRQRPHDGVGGRCRRRP